MKATITGIDLNQADIDFLKYLHAVKVASYEQINRDIYPSYQLKSVANRLRLLEDTGLIWGQRLRFFLAGRRVVSISKKGFESFVAKESKESERRIELKSEVLDHDLVLVDIRSRLKQGNRIGEYLTENQVQTWGSIEYGADIASLANMNSDAIVEVKFPDEQVWVPLEYEGNGKSEARYELLVRKYYAKDDVPVVLYICESKAIMEKIAKVERAVYMGDQPKFFFALFPEIMKDDALTFRNCNLHSIKLNENHGHA